MYYDDPMVLDRFEHPRSFGKLDHCTHQASGDNPFCGDTIKIYLSVREYDGRNVIEQARFEGYACSLCTASTDLLLESIVGNTTEQALSLTLEDLLELWGGLELGRTRKGCVELSLRILSRALEE